MDRKTRKVERRIEDNRLGEMDFVRERGRGDKEDEEGDKLQGRVMT